MAGQTVYFMYCGRMCEAKVEQGDLPIDGSLFDNPTPAALLIANCISVNGWKAWKTAARRELGSLRRF